MLSSQRLGRLLFKKGTSFVFSIHQIRKGTKTEKRKNKSSLSRRVQFRLQTLEFIVTLSNQLIISSAPYNDPIMAAGAHQSFPGGNLSAYPYVLPKRKGWRGRWTGNNLLQLEPKVIQSDRIPRAPIYWPMCTLAAIRNKKKKVLTSPVIYTSKY